MEAGGPRLEGSQARGPRTWGGIIITTPPKISPFFKYFDSYIGATSPFGVGMGLCFDFAQWKLPSLHPNVTLEHHARPLCGLGILVWLRLLLTGDIDVFAAKRDSLDLLASPGQRKQGRKRLTVGDRTGSLTSAVTSP